MTYLNIKYKPQKSLIEGKSKENKGTEVDRNSINKSRPRETIAAKLTI